MTKIITSTFAVILVLGLQLLILHEQAIVDDKDAIVKTVNQYGYYYDANNIEGLANLFAPTSSTELVRGQGSESGSRGELIAFIKSRMASKRGAGIIRRHLFTNTIIHQITVDNAEVSSAVLLMNSQDNRLTPFLTALYEFSLIKIEGRWLIQHLKIDSDLKFQ